MAGTKCNAVAEKDSPEGETFSKKSALHFFFGGGGAKALFPLSKRLGLS